MPFKEEAQQLAADCRAEERVEKAAAAQILPLNEAITRQTLAFERIATALETIAEIHGNATIRGPEALALNVNAHVTNHY